MSETKFSLATADLDRCALREHREYSEHLEKPKLLISHYLQ